MIADQIIIEGLSVQTIVGVLAHERLNKQPVTIDLSLSASILPAAQSDQLQDAIDYASLSENLLMFVAESSFQLIETLAQAIANWLLANFPIDKVSVTLRKPQALSIAKNVGVIIERNRNPL